MKELIKKLHEDLINKIMVEWKSCRCLFFISRGADFSKSGMIRTDIEVVNCYGESDVGDKRILMKSRELKSKIALKYENLITDVKFRFNKVELLILQDGSFQ